MSELSWTHAWRPAQRSESSSRATMGRRRKLWAQLTNSLKCGYAAHIAEHLTLPGLAFSGNPGNIDTKMWLLLLHQQEVSWGPVADRG